MSESSEIVSVFILDKEYQINCPADEVDSLMESAEFLDHKMKEIKKNSAVYGLERIAVMAALNIANDYISQSSQSKEVNSLQTDDLRLLGHKVEQVIKRIKATQT